ncbi:sulfotransferase 1C4 isoform X1 [Frankliniella occidentalis]|uniref:Sulfotransferase 1C4 isoform X1 n=1 Tax=Frankliniella occidentalis TaxID=133901 RepID=A0A6J1S939_FRAOC|nr:sulfotransferase 1C4 isoform X1 [Frankliniella occidentalis]
MSAMTGEPLGALAPAPCAPRVETVRQTAPAAAEDLPMQWVTGEPLQRLLRDFSGERTGYVRISDKGYFFPSKFATEMPHFVNFKARPSDTWVVTYPRSGTTWTQEMVWLLANDLDFDTARSVPLNDRFPFFEFSGFFHEATTREFLEHNAGSTERQQAVLDMATPGYRLLANAPSPRFIKTHLPFTLLPRNLLNSGAKVIYLARNPKDVAVSFFHMNRLILTQGYTGDFETYWNYFQNDLHAWTPYWSHLEEGWQRRTHPRVLFMFYEEMRKDTPAAIRKVAHFLGKQLNDEQEARLGNHLDIVNFRKNPAVNSEALYDLGIMRRDEQAFIRKGEVGGWKNYFTPELEAQADQWIAENLAKTDMRFPDCKSGC